MARLLPIFVVLVSLLLLAHAANKCHRLVNGRKSIETCRGKGKGKWGCYTLIAKGKKSKGCVPIHGRRGKRGGGFEVEVNCPVVNGVKKCPGVTVDNGDTEVEIKPSEVEESGGMDFDLPSDIGDLPTLPDGDLPELNDIDVDMGDVDLGDSGSVNAADLLDEMKSSKGPKGPRTKRPPKGPGPGPAGQPEQPRMPRSFALGCSRINGVKICTCAKNLCNNDQVSHTLAAPAAIIMVLLSGVL